MRTPIWKTICTLALSLPLLTASPYIARAQEYANTPVTVSKEKVRVGGKLCYSHIVLEKQTLYSISKAYEVSIDDIYKYNPSVKENGLKKNSIILIPINEAPKEVAKKEPVKKEPARKEEPKVAEQKVAEQKAVKPTVAEPEVKPAEKKEVEKKEVKKEKQIIHVRKWYEDLDMISAQYGVSAEAIMKANGLSGKKLSKRQKLIIPSGEDSAFVAQEVPQQAPQQKEAPEYQDIASSADTLGQESADEVFEDAFIFPKSKVNATLLLPMRNAERKLSRNNMDFYSGVMLAVYDLAQKGTNVDLNVYDITDAGTPVTKEDIEESDMVIGPISTADLTRLFQSAPEVKTVISPLDPRAERLVATHRDMIQVPTPHKAQYQDLVDWIKEDLKENDKVFMFSERIARNNDAVSTMKEVMDSSGIEYTPFTYSILEGRDIVTPLKEMMTAEGANRIYIASESEAFVNDVVRNLNLMLIENFQVILYAPSKIRSFDTIEVEHFHKTSMHVSLTYYINYEDQAVKDFLLKYRALYNTEPTQFAFQGYDIASYFIGLCQKYGNRWKEKLSESEKAMLQSTFKCVKQGSGGYVNNGVRRIVYEKNWTITQVK